MRAGKKNRKKARKNRARGGRWGGEEGRKPKQTKTKKKKKGSGGGGTSGEVRPGTRERHSEREQGRMAQGGRERRTTKQNQEKNKEKKRGGLEHTKSAKAQGTQGRGAQKARDSGGARGDKEERGRNKQTQKKKHPKHQQPQPGRVPTKKKDKRSTGKVRRTKTRPGGRPARPSQGEHTQAHTRGTWGCRPPTQKEEVLASTRNSPGAPAESPVEKRTVPETGSVSDRVHTRQTTAAHAARDQSRRDPLGTTPSRGPERVRRGTSPAPLPCQGLVAGTKSSVLGRPPRAPRSRPVKPGGTVPGD